MAANRPAIILDTSVYIRILRGNSTLEQVLPWPAVLWMSAVVREKLYAGASNRDVHSVEKLERDS